MDDPNLRDDLGADEDTDVSISASLARVAVEMHRLTKQLAKNEPKINTIERRSFWSIFVSAFLVLGVVLLFATTVMGFTVVSYIRDCTDPAGQCYRDSRARTTEVEARILKAQKDEAERTLGAVCAVFDGHNMDRPADCPPR